MARGAALAACGRAPLAVRVALASAVTTQRVRHAWLCVMEVAVGGMGDGVVYLALISAQSLTNDALLVHAACAWSRGVAFSSASGISKHTVFILL